MTDETKTKLSDSDIKKINEVFGEYLKGTYGIDDTDLKILSEASSRTSATNFLTTVAVYNVCKDTYKSIFRFVFLTIPIFITFPIWALFFDIYRSFREQKIKRG